MEARNNQWEPVTEVYQHVDDPAAASSIDDPMAMVNAVRRARIEAEGKAPFGNSAITGLYFLRAAIYALFAARLLAPANSNLIFWIQIHCPALIPFSLSSVEQKKLPTTMAEVLGGMAVLCLALGLMWLFRWIPVLFISLAVSGYLIAHLVVSYFNIAGLGDSSLFDPTQINIVVIDGALNLLIFFYIILYPKLADTFRRAS